MKKLWYVLTQKIKLKIMVKHDIEARLETQQFFSLLRRKANLAKKGK